MVERLDAARYVVIAGAITACFNNLIDEINKGSNILNIAFYSGVLLLFAVILVFSQNKYVLGTILFVSGVIMVFASFEPGEISGGIIFIGYSIFLIQNKYYEYSVYAIMFLTVVAIHVFSNSGPEDMLNILMAYTVIFALNKIVYEGKIDER